MAEAYRDSADGRYIAAISERSGYYYEAILIDENNVTLWKFSVGDAFPDPQHVEDIDWISISNDGSYVAFGGIYWNGTDDLGYAYLFNQQGQIWNKTGFYSSQGFDILVQGELSGDGSRLVLNYVVTSFLGNFSIEVYNTGRFSVTPAQFMWRYDTGDIECDSVSISFAGDYVALGCDGAVFLVHAPAAGVHEGILVWQDDNDGENFWPIRISDDGKYVCTGTFGGHGGWDVFGWFVCYNQTGKPLWNYTTEWETAYWAHDLDSFSRWTICCGSGKLHNLLLRQDRLKWTYDTNNPTDLGHVRISADGNFVIARARDNQFDIWHLNKFGKLIWHIPSSDDMGSGPIAISANGEYFCSADFLSGDLQVLF